jgi:hypothetical protein
VKSIDDDDDDDDDVVQSGRTYFLELQKCYTKL